jgi:hypothetical protein
VASHFYPCIFPDTTVNADAVRLANGRPSVSSHVVQMMSEARVVLKSSPACIYLVLEPSASQSA